MITILMKKLIIILLFIPFALQGQNKAVKSIAFDVAHVMLDATGDALNDSGQKGWGHTANAMAVGVLVAQPFVIDFQKEDWKWKLPAYIATRFALFNLTYNAVHPGIDDLMYYGTTDPIDKTMSQMMPGNSQLFPKGIALTFSISLTLNYVK